MTLLAIFGGTALLLAAIGLYAVMLYAVSQSTRELALRMALGASVSDLLRLVLSRGLALTVGGLILGAAAAFALTRLLANRLYQVSPHDPIAFGSALIVMTIVALFACLLPARRATRIDPRAPCALESAIMDRRPCFPPFPVRRGQKEGSVCESCS